MKKDGWQSKKGKWNWRKFLSPEEVELIKKSDALLEQIERLRKSHTRQFGAHRQVIVNRAIHRAKYEAKKAEAAK